MSLKSSWKKTKKAKEGLCLESMLKKHRPGKKQRTIIIEHIRNQPGNSSGIAIALCNLKSSF
ncbi:MAG: hypothetical protein ACRCU0_07050 [Candidatus Rhabdochlamydia sp.]